MRTAAWESKTPDSSEKLLKVAVGKVGTYVILVKGSPCNQAHIFL